MRALIVTAFGGPEVLEWQELPDPAPGPGEVLIRVTGFAVNWADLMQRRGAYPGGPRPPFQTGHDLVGRIVDHGQGVESPRVGDRIFGVLAHPGTAAELVVAPAHWLHRVPRTVTDKDAAGMASPFFTADAAIVTFGRLQPGETVLVHAAAGGFGSAAVQLARAYGAGTIVATAGSDAKLRRVGDWGADVLINYNTHDLVEPVLHASGGHGVDLVIESVGGEVLDQSFDCLAPLGRLVSVGASSGRGSRRFRLHTLFEKNVSVAGFTLGLLLAQHPELVTPGVERVMHMLEDGAVQPVVDRVFHPEDVAEAHRYLEARRSVGRTVVMMA
ncbi:MAG: zinc-binding alcohol dehydrogenase family protein [Acidimicrobiia bacterium]